VTRLEWNFHVGMLRLYADAGRVLATSHAWDGQNKFRESVDCYKQLRRHADALRRFRAQAQFLKHERVRGHG